MSCTGFTPQPVNQRQARCMRSSSTSLRSLVSGIPVHQGTAVTEGCAHEGWAIGVNIPITLIEFGGQDPWDGSISEIGITSTTVLYRLAAKIPVEFLQFGTRCALHADGRHRGHQLDERAEAMSNLSQAAQASEYAGTHRVISSGDGPRRGDAHRIPRTGLRRRSAAEGSTQCWIVTHGPMPREACPAEGRHVRSVRCRRSQSFVHAGLCLCVPTRRGPPDDRRRSVRHGD